ncbi:endonuclease/exonuclease/phosphatase family protein [Myxococcus sp. RHSTA-1-4]|uniref:endonuclease/exonuclease/phosphatase family protein n=1 Tax=Myxococcus sp. RHSTA-1-4 TaxID=2874601 RepID=UPI001CBEB247|nr:endonuclease/exonuclease/phosphatase family protein [Myxococcus sp. RHSTA-1-4]MBZ4423230.1 endonuclease/exonuclease/phosphatase family protein [Myxococcus sp. RHSTA-1-4]
MVLPHSSELRPNLRRGATLLGLVLSLLGCQGRVTDSGPEDTCPTGDCETPEVPTGRPEGSLRIAAFNVHRFFDTVCHSGQCGGSAYEALPSPEAFAAQADQLAGAIDALDADVVLLAELETQASLDALTARLPRFRDDAGTRRSVLGETGSAASVDVAVLSAHSITTFRGHRDRVLTRPDGTTTRFSRELLEVHLDTPGGKTVVFSAHFRSKVDDDPGRRYAEADAARDIVATAARESPGALVVLGGDLNDVPGSAPLDALERDGVLLRVSSDRPASETWTYSYFGDRQAIDHLHLARGGGSYVPGSFKAVRESRGGYGGSDHAAVSADFLPAR